MNKAAFSWEWCSQCGWMLRCPKCHNNCCNGGYGLAADGTSCTLCPAIYELQDLLEQPSSSEELVELGLDKQINEAIRNQDYEAAAGIRAKLTPQQRADGRRRADDWLMGMVGHIPTAPMLDSELTPTLDEVKEEAHDRVEALLDDLGNATSIAQVQRFREELDRAIDALPVPGKLQ